MNEHSNPLDYLIECCQTAINTGHWKLNQFTINNAKDELAKLRQAKADMTADVFTANQNSADNTNRWLSCEKELCSLKDKIKGIFSQPVAYGLINDRLNLYDLRLYNNPYNDQTNVVPLYSNKKEFIEYINGTKSKE